MTMEKLTQEILNFCKANKIRRGHFADLAGLDRAIIYRLTNGQQGTISLESYQRIRALLDEKPSSN